MTLAHIGLGSNLGDRQQALARAVRRLTEVGTLKAVSPLYETAPVGNVPQPRYLNAVVVLETGLAPGPLLAHLQAVERSAGRRRQVRWGSRTLDLDLLAFGRVQASSPELTLPHPEAHRRAFVLAPWKDVAPTASLYGRPLAFWWARRPPSAVQTYASGPWWLAEGEWWPEARLAANLWATLRASGVRTRDARSGLLEVVDGPGLLTAASLRRWGAGEPWEWAVYDRVDTTMRVAAEGFRAAGRPVAVLAEQQDAGRGRRGRAWMSEPGASLLVSFAWAPWDHELRGPLTLVAGVAAVRAVRAVTGMALRLKWPNDGLVDGGKCIGVLAEAQHGRPSRVVVGFGLNVNGSPDRLPVGAATLEGASGRPWPRAALAAALGAMLGDVLAEWRADKGQATGLLDEWRTADLTLGRNVTIHPGTGEPFAARAEAVRDDGALLVRRGDTGSVQPVLAADVSLRFSPRSR